MTPCCGCCHLSGWLLAGGFSKGLAESHSPHMRLPAGSYYEHGDPKKAGKGPQQTTVGGRVTRQGNIRLNWVFVWWLTWQDGCKMILSTYCILSTLNPGLFFLEGKQACLTG